MTTEWLEQQIRINREKEKKYAEERRKRNNNTAGNYRLPVGKKPTGGGSGGGSAGNSTPPTSPAGRLPEPNSNWFTKDILDAKKARTGERHLRLVSPAGEANTPIIGTEGSTVPPVPAVNNPGRVGVQPDGPIE